MILSVSEEERDAVEWYIRTARKGFDRESSICWSKEKK